MRHRRRGGFGGGRKLLTALAILASVAVVAKIVRGIYRGETIQSRVKPL